jgi:hypothetical protein
MFLGIVILMGLCIAIVLAMVLLTPKIAGAQPTFQYVPNTSVTGFPTAPQRIDKEKLIIQQNNQCWIGVPGATCDPKIRTYA